MSTESRRHFLTTSGKLLFGAATAGALAPYAAQAEEQQADPEQANTQNAEPQPAAHQHGFGGGVVVDAASEGMCLTCDYWGGMRMTSDDRTQVSAQSLGWCNNPDSPNYHKLTAADHKMKKTGIWKKWGAL
jgi:hypothetical protein